MPWKDNYTSTDEISLGDTDVKWPKNKVCCVRIVVDMGTAHGRQGLVPSDLAESEAVFSWGRGLDLLVELFGKHSIKATFAVPAMLASIYQSRLRLLKAMGHEVAVAGLKYEDPATLTQEEEARRIDTATKIMSDVLGEKPSGWFSLPRDTDAFAVGSVSQSTIDLLIDTGYRYFGNGLADDIPYYWVTNPAEKKALLTLPYYYHFNDQYFMMYPRKGSGLDNGDSLLRNWHREFDAQYARGRQFEMTLHPEHSGWAHRLRGLNDFLVHMGRYDGVWNVTSAECAAWWLESYPASSTLKLSPPIWKDYEGSLS